MTIDEAIQHCREQVQEQAKKGCYSCAEEHQQLAEWLKELKAYRNKSEIPTSCGDAISRQAAKRALEDRFMELQKRHNDKRYETNYCLNTILELPSVTPQQRTGRWIEKEEEGDAEPFIIWECSECHCVCEDGKPSYKYCPQCGANMEAEDI